MTHLFVLAHAGHWIESVVFGVPVLILAAVMLVDRFRTQRRERRQPGRKEPPSMRKRGPGR